ncbi:MAG: VCBS repeat-containing protein [Nitrospirae bacterium]|nr:MAG: VCBS repeat-containing protein [Nitrospirota bacterium]
MRPALIWMFTIGIVLGAWSASQGQNLVFTPTSRHQVGHTPQAIVAGDFNQDGRLDVVTVNSTSDDVSVLLGNGNGTFRAAVSFGVGKMPMFVAAEDLTGDGRLDLAVALSGSDRIRILKGRGNGLFDPIGSFPSGKGTTFLTVHDLNGDGKLDIVAANSGRFGYYPPFSISVLLNDGTGHMVGPMVYETEGRNGMFPTGVFVDDFTADGKPDLAISWSQSSWRTPNGLISLLVNQGDGRFAVGRTVQAGKTLSAITGADVNQDGRTDLIATSLFTDSVNILLQEASGEFSPLDPIPVGFSPVAVQVGDLNEDGQLDIIVTNRDSSSVSTLLGNGHGEFRSAGHFGVGETPSGLIVKDFDQDGLLDLATADSSSNGVSVLLNGRVLLPLPSLSADALVFELGGHEPRAGRRTLRVSNVGLGALKVFTVHVRGQDSHLFSLTSNRCEGATLRTGDFCTIDIAFSAPSPGKYTAEMTIVDNANGGPRSIILQGVRRG